jgi:hypothetical protein
MIIPWAQILIAALTSSVFTASVLAALAYVGRSIIERWLVRSLEKYKAELQLAAFEHQTRFTKLHEKRAEVIAELYKRLVQIQYSLRRLAHFIRSATSNQSQYAEKETTITQSSLNEFKIYFEGHRLYFTEGLCGTVEKFHAESLVTLIELLSAETSKMLLSQSPSESPSESRFQEQYTETIRKALDRVEQQVPSLKREIEKEFRKMLGVD